MKIRKSKEEKNHDHDIIKNVKDNLTSEITDPFGSYTGNSKDPYDIPVQDADDL